VSCKVEVCTCVGWSTQVTKRHPCQCICELCTFRRILLCRWNIYVSVTTHCYLHWRIWNNCSFLIEYDQRDIENEQKKEQPSKSLVCQKEHCRTNTDFFSTRCDPFIRSMKLWATKWEIFQVCTPPAELLFTNSISRMLKVLIIFDLTVGERLNNIWIVLIIWIWIF